MASFKIGLLMVAPLALLNLVNSLNLVGIPSTAASGERISPRVVPDITPLPDGSINPLFNPLSQVETLAGVELDLKPLLGYLAQVIAFTSDSLHKAVEFGDPIESTAAAVDVTTPIVHELPHLVPKKVGGQGAAVESSTYTAGLVGDAIGKLMFDPDAPGKFLSKLKAAVNKPAALGSVDSVSLTFAILDASKRPLASDKYVMGSTPPTPPEFAILPEIREPSGNSLLPVRLYFECDIEVEYTTIGGTQETLPPVKLGPLPLDLQVTQLPVIAVLTEHAVGTASFPGRVLMAVPEDSPITSATDAFSYLRRLRETLSTVELTLGFLGVGQLEALSAALSAITTVVGLSPGRFRKGNFTAFLEPAVGIPPWDDWQNMFSAAFLFGPSTRRAHLARLYFTPPTPKWPPDVTQLQLPRFTMVPGNFGVAAIPNLAGPLTATVGVAAQLFPAPPTPIPHGAFNDSLTSINFS